MLESKSLNALDVAEILHIGKNHVYELAKSGELASYRIGRKLRFSLGDVEAYLDARRKDNATLAAKPTTSDCLAARHLSELELLGSRLPRRKEVIRARCADPSNDFRIAGSELVADLLTSGLNAHNERSSHRYVESYEALVDLYIGKSDAAVINLYDQRSNAYNTSFARHLAPGLPMLVMHLTQRRCGFLVAWGNPKHITSWGALLHDGIRLANSPIGSGQRVLLDEKIISLEARPEDISGYKTELPTQRAVAESVASGVADIGIGSAKDVLDGVELVPIQNERIDLVVVKTERTRHVIRTIKQLLCDKRFQADVSHSSGEDTSTMGAIIYES